MSSTINDCHPAAIIYRNELSGEMEKLLKEHNATASMVYHKESDVTVMYCPEIPDIDEYMNEGDVDESLLDEESYNDAMQQYDIDMAEFQLRVENGQFQKALVIRNEEFIPVLFCPERPVAQEYVGTKKTVSMKAVQESIKSGNANSEIIQEAIDGILEREKRAKEIDSEKIQLSIHSCFVRRCQILGLISPLTDADQLAVKLLIFQTLDWNTKRIVEEALFSCKDDGAGCKKYLTEQLAELTTAQYVYLIRMAISCKADSKFPSSDAGRVLFEIAKSAGIDVIAIQDEQEEKAITRNQRMLERINELKKKKEKLSKQNKTK